MQSAQPPHASALSPAFSAESVNSSPSSHCDSSKTCSSPESTCECYTLTISNSWSSPVCQMRITPSFHTSGATRRSRTRTCSRMCRLALSLSLERKRRRPSWRLAECRRGRTRSSTFGSTPVASTSPITRSSARLSTLCSAGTRKRKYATLSCTM